MNLGQIVTITDTDTPMTGIITKVRIYSDMTVYTVTTLNGTRWSREEQDLTPAPEADATQFASDVKILAPTHAELAEAFAQVIEAADTVTPGLRLLDIPLSRRMPSGNVITRRETAAEIIRTIAEAKNVRPTSVPYFPRSVTEVI